MMNRSDKSVTIAMTRSTRSSGVHRKTRRPQPEHQTAFEEIEWPHWRHLRRAMFSEPHGEINAMEVDQTSLASDCGLQPCRRTPTPSPRLLRPRRAERTRPCLKTHSVALGRQTHDCFVLVAQRIVRLIRLRSSASHSSVWQSIATLWGFETGPNFHMLSQ